MSICHANTIIEKGNLWRLLGFYEYIYMYRYPIYPKPIEQDQPSANAKNQFKLRKQENHHLGCSKKYKENCRKEVKAKVEIKETERSKIKEWRGMRI